MNVCIFTQQTSIEFGRMSRNVWYDFPLSSARRDINSCAVVGTLDSGSSNTPDKKKRKCACIDGILSSTAYRELDDNSLTRIAENKGAGGMRNA